MVRVVGDGDVPVGLGGVSRPLGDDSALVARGGLRPQLDREILDTEVEAPVGRIAHADLVVSAVEARRGVVVMDRRLDVEPAIHDDNTAARFDGGNDKVSVSDPANGSLDFGVEDFTVELWTKAAASDKRGVVSKRSANAAEPYWDVTVTDDPNHNGQIRAVYFDGTNTRTAYSASGVVDGLWHHVAVWFDRDGGITIFIDGSARFTALAMTPDVVIQVRSRSGSRRRTPTSAATSTRSPCTAACCPCSASRRTSQPLRDGAQSSGSRWWPIHHSPSRQ